MQTRKEVMNAVFLDVRCMALEIAAALDRLDRSGAESADADSRMGLLKQALDIVSSPSKDTDRVKRILQLFSDPVD